MTDASAGQTERQLIRLAADGDARAIRMLYDRYAPRVYAVVRRIAADDDLAQDYAQEAWIRAIRALPTFRGDARFSTWLHRIAVNAALQSLRKADTRARREEDSVEEVPVDPRQTDSLLQKRLERALDTLPEGMREVLILHDVEGYTHEEIGDVLGVTSGTSKSQLFKARAKMRALLSGLAETATRTRSRSMKHLTMDTLARLVDESAQPDEAKHLATCEACAEELAALRAQSESLAALPEIVPPLGDWKVLEAKLRSEGLVRDPGLFQKLGLARTPSWMPAAAAVVLFLGGTGFGAAVTSRGAGSATTAAGPVASLMVEDAGSLTVEDAASAVRRAEQEYVSAVSRYREVMETQGGDAVAVDPVTRYAALEHLVSVSQAAVRQAPGDPFLNGFLASALAERDAAARQVSANRDNWF